MNSYDHLIPEIDAAQGTLLIYALLVQVFPPETHKLLLHALARVEELGRDGWKENRKR